MKAGWALKRLGDLTDLVTKGTTPTSIGHSFTQEGVNFIKVESISLTGQFIEGKFARVSAECHAALKRSQLQAGDILFSIAGALGRTAFVTDDVLPANTNQALSIIRLKPDPDVSPAFVRKALETGFVLEQVEKVKGGVAQQNLSLAQVSDFTIPLPPLPEQQRIVTLLDEAFDGIATAKANAEKSLLNARAIFESHLQSVFAQSGDGWVERRLDEIAEFSQGIQVGVGDQKNAPEVGFVRFIRIVDYTQGTDDIRYVQNPGSRYWVNKADLVMVRYGTPGLIGRGIEGVIANNLFKITVADKSLLNDFLAYALGRESVQTYLSTQGASTMPALTFKQLGTVVVPYPKALAEQAAIVSLLDTIQEETQRLESIYQQKLTALDELKKSLLHRAFNGDL